VPVIACVAATLGVYVTEQLLADGPLLARVQLEGLKVPVELEAKLTVPVGLLAAPVLEVSVTVTVHVVVSVAEIGAGAHATAVEVERGATVRVKLPLLPV
jgi:hypothetical protein